MGDSTYPIRPRTRNLVRDPSENVINRTLNIDRDPVAPDQRTGSNNNDDSPATPGSFTTQASDGSTQYPFILDVDTLDGPAVLGP
jgi:hypothetical protein